MARCFSGQKAESGSLIMRRTGAPPSSTPPSAAHSAWRSIAGIDAGFMRSAAARVGRSLTPDPLRDALAVGSLALARCLPPDCARSAEADRLRGPDVDQYQVG